MRRIVALMAVVLVGVSVSHGQVYQYCSFSTPAAGNNVVVPTGAPYALSGSMYAWISTNGSGSYHTVTNVSLFCNGAKIGNATLTSPASYGSWTYNWNPVTYGSVALKAISSSDIGGATATVSCTFSSVNTLPVAYNIHFQININTTNQAVTASYSDPDSGQSWTAAVVSPPSHGTIASISGTTFFYTPNAGYSGQDLFTYKVNDGFSDSNIAQCRLLVCAPNQRGGALVALIVNTNLFAGGISNEVARLKADLEREGYFAKIKLWPASGTSASNLWQYLRTEYDDASQFLQGAILIGDLPKVQTYANDPYSGYCWTYTDLIYWNMRKFQTTDEITTRNIWVSRINADDTSWGSQDTLIRRALDANHNYRTGASRLPFTAYVFDCFTTNPVSASMLDVWPSVRFGGGGDHGAYYKFLPGRTDLYYAACDALVAGGEVFNECSHGNESGYMEGGWFDKNALYRVVAQQRAALIGSCSSGAFGGIVNNHVFTRGGGCIFAVGGTTINWGGDYNINSYGGDAFRKRLGAGDSWGGGCLYAYPFEGYRTGNRIVFYGDMSMRAMASVYSNSMPRITSYTASNTAWNVVNFSVAASDPDGTVGNIEWFAQGYNGGRNAPTASGTSPSVTYTYASPGVYTTRVEVEDNYKAREWRELTVTINRAPWASNDLVSVQAGQAVTVAVLANDGDPDGQAMTLDAVTASPTKGTAVIQGSAIVYTSTNHAASGTDTFTYRVKDPIGATASATVTVTILADVTPPTLSLVSALGSQTQVSLIFSEPVEASSATTRNNYAIDNGVSISGASLSADGRTVTLTTSVLASNVVYTLTVNNVRDLAATPNTIAASTSATFQYRDYVQGIAWDYYTGTGNDVPDFNAMTPVKSGVTNNITLAMRTQDVNIAFRFRGKVSIGTAGAYTFYTTSDDGSLLWVDGGLLVNNNGGHGMQERSGATNLAAGLHDLVVGFSQGGGGFGLEVRWDGPGIAKALIPDNVLFTSGAGGQATNRAPIAVADSATTAEDTSVLINVVANDTDADSDQLSVTSVQLAGHGTTVLESGKVRYAPAANYNGADTFTYVVTDGKGGYATGTVSVTVTPVNDAPAIGSCAATPTNGTAPLAVAFAVSATDVDGDTLTYSWVFGDGATGSGANINHTYTNAGTFTAALTVADGKGGTATASKTIAVSAANRPPVANAQSVTTTEDTAKAIVLVGSDPDGDALTYGIVSNPAKGTLSGTAPNVTYTPAANYNGADSFTFRVSDPSGASGQATVSVTVTAVNDAPVISSCTATPTNGTAPLAVSFAASANDVDGDTLAYDWAFGDGGTGSGQTANRTYATNGSYVATLTVSDGKGGTTTAQVRITVAGGGVVETVWVEDVLPAGAVSYPDSDTWAWTNANPAPYSGTLAHRSAALLGMHQHYFQNATQTLSVAVGERLFTWVYLNPTNPVSEVMVQFNDGSWEHRAYWGANQVNAGADGTVARRCMGPLPGSGTWVRLEVPALLVGLEGRTLNGMAYTLYGGQATWDRSGKVSGGAPANNPPLAVADSATTAEDVAVLVNVLGNDSDRDGDTICILDVASANGSCTIEGSQVRYAPAANWNGTNVFTYRVADLKGAVATGTVTVVVTPVNDAPSVALTAPAEGSGFDAPATLTIQANAADVDGSIARVEFYQGATKLGEDATSPYAFTWSGVAAGSYVVTAKAVDNTGLVGTSTGVSIDVVPAGAGWGLVAEFFDFNVGLSALPGLNGRTADVTRVDLRVNYPSTGNAWPGLPSSMADTFASRHTGCLVVPTAGTYTLYLNSDDGSALWLDGVKVIDNDGLHGMAEKSVSLNLADGDHQIRIEFFENGGGAGLIFSWAGPGIAKQVVPPNVLRQQQSNQPPVALAGVDPINGTTLDEFYFWATDSYDPDGVVNSYQWTVNSEEVSTQAEFLYSFPTTGVYNVTLTVWDNKGASDSDLVQVQVTEPAVTVSVEVPDSMAGEPGLAEGAGTIRVRRTGSTSAALTVNVAFSGDASNGVDYAALVNTVVIPAGAVYRDILISPLADALDEPDETVILTVLSGTGYTVDAGASAGLVLIKDQTYGTPVVSAEATDAVAKEPMQTTDKGSIKVSRTGSCHAALTLNCTLGGTAVNGVDYSPVTVPVVLAVGQSSKVLTIAPLADGVVESNETVVVTLTTNAAYQIQAGKGTATVTIQDATVLTTPVVSVVATDADAQEPAGGVLNYGYIRFARTTRFHETLTVNCTVGGTASNGVDYVMVTVPIVFAVGEGIKDTSIRPIADSVAEGVETAIFTITAGTGYTVDAGKATATVSIRD